MQNRTSRDQMQANERMHQQSLAFQNRMASPGYHQAMQEALYPDLTQWEMAGAQGAGIPQIASAAMSGEAQATSARMAADTQAATQMGQSFMDAATGAGTVASEAYQRHLDRENQLDITRMQSGVGIAQTLVDAGAPLDEVNAALTAAGQAPLPSLTPLLVRASVNELVMRGVTNAASAASMFEGINLTRQQIEESSKRVAHLDTQMRNVEQLTKNLRQEHKRLAQVTGKEAALRAQEEAKALVAMPRAQWEAINVKFGRWIASALAIGDSIGIAEVKAVNKLGSEFQELGVSPLGTAMALGMLGISTAGTAYGVSKFRPQSGSPKTRGSRKPKSRAKGSPSHGHKTRIKGTPGGNIHTLDLGPELLEPEFRRFNHPNSANPANPQGPEFRVY